MGASTVPLAISFPPGSTIRAGFLVSFDNGARFNGQRRTVSDVTPSLHQVSAPFQVLMIFYLEGLFSVSDDILTINNVIALSGVLVVRTAAAGQAHQCCQCDNL